MTRDQEMAQADRALADAYRARLQARPAGDHPGDDAWEAWATGELDEAARVRLADHVASCSACRDIYTVVSGLMETASDIDSGAPAPSRAADAAAPWRGYGPVMLAAAAAMVVAVVATLLSMWPRTGASPGSEPAAARSAPASVAPGAVPAAPEFRLAMVAPEVQLPADLVVVTRGPEGAAAQRFLEEFGRAIAPYRERRYDEAVDRLSRLGAAHGGVAEVWFYLGVSQLFAGRPVEALASFDRPGLADAIGDDLGWQRAVALERLGRVGEMGVVLRTLCGRDGPYRERACAAMGPATTGPTGR